MSYLLYTLALFFFIFVSIMLVTRAYWLPYVQRPSLLYTAVPRDGDENDNFFSDAAAGLHSTNFDLSSNIEAGDARAGLDEAGKKAVRKIMKKRGVGFDEARRMVMLDKFRREGVGEDGTPTDPRFVSFGNGK